MASVQENKKGNELFKLLQYLLFITTSNFKYFYQFINSRGMLKLGKYKRFLENGYFVMTHKLT